MTKIDGAAVAERFLAGESQVSIARSLGVSQSGISRRLRARGLTRPGRPSGPDHPSWKGGRAKHGDGYVYVRSDEFPEMRRTCHGYVFEHRLVMARKLDRALRDDEEVHHRNGNRSDNWDENLELRSLGHGRGATRHCPTCTCDED